MANSTILSIGGVTVSTSGGMTGDLLQKVVNLVTTPGASNQVAVAAGAPIPTPSGAGGIPDVLVLASDYAGNISIPAGYEYVVYTGTGSLTGGDSHTALLGSGLTYQGSAGTVLGTGGNENINDSVDSGTFSFFQGNYTLTAAGSGDTISTDAAASGSLNVSGNNDTIVVAAPGTGPSAAGAAAAGGANIIAISGTNETTSIAGASNLVFLTGTDDITQSGGSSTIITGSGGLVTLNALGGTQVVFDNSADAHGQVINAGPATEFVGALGAGAATITGSSGGADTVFAVGSVDYQGARSANTFFVGGAGVATVFAGATATLFGGAGGGTYTEGHSTFFFWGYGGSSDTVLGGSGAAQATIWGNHDQNTTVVQTDSQSPGGIYVAWSNNDSINAASAVGGNSFIVVDQNLILGGTSQNFSGDTTLVGSNAGNDTVAFFAENSTNAHTIEIDNWKASDVLYLGGFSAADSATASAALAAAGGGATSFTLSDNTTIKFVGASPTSHA